MDKELQDKIISKFPWMNNIPYGICVGNGWYNLIYALCLYIDNAIKFENQCITDYQNDIKNGIDVNEKWSWKPVDKLYDFPTVSQIKEKFGALRFYCSLPNLWRYELRGAVNFAELISATICEDCGNKGQLRDYMWRRTLCDVCDAKIKNQNKKVET